MQEESEIYLRCNIDTPLYNLRNDSDYSNYCLIQEKNLIIRDNKINLTSNNKREI